MKNAGEFIGGTEECTLSFGETTGPADRVVRFSNPGVIDTQLSVTFDDEEVQQSAAFSFTADAPPIVPPDQYVEVTVYLVPLAAGSASTKIQVASDAANFPAGSDGTIEIDVSAEIDGAP